ncbi:MAG: hypothetical protein HY200_03865 [Nitrospirae bacterium]|nr:hypothetical protein [Nitrospirota bacterium]
MSKSRVLKRNTESQGLNTYDLQKVTASRNATPFAYNDGIGGNGYETERDGYLRGFSAGEQAGKEQGLKEVEAQFHFLTELVEKLKSVEQELVKSSQNDVIQLSLAVAKQIIQKEIAQTPDRLQATIREAMNKMDQSDKFVIRLHPADKATLSQNGASIVQEVQKLKSIRFEADSNLQPGECIIESHAKMIDGRVDSQLALFGEAFLKSLEKT